MKLFTKKNHLKCPYPLLDSPFRFHPQGIDSIEETEYHVLRQRTLSCLAETSWQGPIKAINYATKAALFYGATGIALLAETLLQSCILNKNRDEPYESDLVHAIALFTLAKTLLRDDEETTQAINSESNIPETVLHGINFTAKIDECFALLPASSNLDDFNSQIESLVHSYKEATARKNPESENK